MTAAAEDFEIFPSQSSVLLVFSIISDALASSLLCWEGEVVVKRYAIQICIMESNSFGGWSQVVLTQGSVLRYLDQLTGRGD